MLSFDWKVSLGDERITPAEFERLLGKAQGIVRFRGQFVYLDPAEVERLRARLARPAATSGSELLRVALAGEVDGAPVGLNKAAEKLIEQLTSTTDVPVPTDCAPRCGPISIAATHGCGAIRGSAWAASSPTTGRRKRSASRRACASRCSMARSASWPKFGPTCC